MRRVLASVMAAGTVLCGGCNGNPVSAIPDDASLLKCATDDGAPAECACALPDGGPVTVCGPGNHCVVNGTCEGDACDGTIGWQCVVQTSTGVFSFPYLCSASQGMVTVNQAVGLGDAVVCSGQCAQDGDAGPWACTVTGVQVEAGGDF